MIRLLFYFHIFYVKFLWQLGAGLLNPCGELHFHISYDKFLLMSGLKNLCGAHSISTSRTTSFCEEKKFDIPRLFILLFSRGFTGVTLCVSGHGTCWVTAGDSTFSTIVAKPCSVGCDHRYGGGGIANCAEPAWKCCTTCAEHSGQNLHLGSSS